MINIIMVELIDDNTMIKINKWMRQRDIGNDDIETTDTLVSTHPLVEGFSCKSPRLQIAFIGLPSEYGSFL